MDYTANQIKHMERKPSAFAAVGGVTDPVYHTSHYYIYVVQNNHLLHAILLFSLPHYGFDIGFETYPKAK